MFGHGCPRAGPGRAVCNASSERKQKWFCQNLRSWCALFAGLWLLGAAAPPVLARELDLRIRLTWGGGAARQWRGSVVATDGELLEPRCLGMEARAATDLELLRDTLRFTQPMAVSSDGLDFRVRGTTDTKLLLELAPSDKREAVQKLEVPLTDFLATVKWVKESSLDDRGNTLRLQRSPGDRLRVEWDAPSLVFAPGEQFTFTLRPNELGIATGTTLRCAMQLTPVDSEDVLWKENRELRVEDDAQVPPVGPIGLKLPDEEGVYDLTLSVFTRRFGDHLVPGPLVTAKPLLQRKVQFVVLSPEPLPADPTPWKLVEEIDVGNPKWWDRLNWLPHWKVLPGKSPRAPLGDRPLQPREVAGRKVYELGRGGWHAVPLPIQEIGQPHLLEVEFPNDQVQLLGISVLEPDSTGEVRGGGLDSGVETEGLLPPRNAEIATHRLVFWPQTRNPWLLFTNRRDDRVAQFGKVRVSAGPLTLPPLKIPESATGRWLASHYELPLLAENFGAAEAVDSATGRAHHDWQTFYLAATRLVEYLRATGRNAATIPIVCEGGTLYPSRWLNGTPKFDDGAFFQSAQDPAQKDVFELLLRLFDREGLKLIPVLQFQGTLPTLEEELRNSRTDLNGIALVGFPTGEQTKLRLGRSDARGGAGPHYNPLDPRVQAAMRQIVGEVLERGASHNSFAGIAIELSPQSYTVLPDLAWGLDDSTFARFAQAARVSNPNGQDRFTQRLAAVRGESRDAWLQWRAAELTTFYGQLYSDVERAKSGCRLLLTTDDLMDGRILQETLRPRLPTRTDFADALLRHGLHFEDLAKRSRATVLRPQRSATTPQLAERGVPLELQHSPAVSDLFQKVGQTGVLLVNKPLPVRLPAFDAVSPFGNGNTQVTLAAEVVPGGAQSRANLVQALAVDDPWLLLDGGDQLPMGQEDAQRRFVTTFRQLPTSGCRNISSTTAGQSPIRVRLASENGRTTIYAVNPTEMEVTVELDVWMPTPCVMVALDGREPPNWPTVPGKVKWNVRLEPYDVAAIAGPAKDLQVTDWRVDFSSDGLSQLTQVVQQLRVRVEQLNRFQPQALIPNADFEQPATGNQIPGWTVAPNPGFVAEIDTSRPHLGRQSLHLKIETPKTIGWVRSQSFPLPKTRRISVQAWIRTKDASRQPPLRMAIDGRVRLMIDGQLAPPIQYYRPSPLGTDIDGLTTLRPTTRKVEAVSQEWTSSPFLLPLTDLPVSGTGELSVGFDLLGPGEVWIDDIQISDSYFEPVERNELLKNVASLHFQLPANAWRDGQPFLNGYWPRFLLETVPPTRVTQATSPAERPATPPAGTAPTPMPTPVEKSPRWKWSIPTWKPFGTR